jgi:hypothetical protein
MASRSDIRAGGAFIELFVKDAKLKQGLAAASAGLHRFGVAAVAAGAAISAAGAAILTPLVVALKSFSAAGTELGDMSARTGVSALRLARLGYAAEQTGASLTDIEDGIRRAARAGFSPDNFEELGQEIARIEDPTKRLARAMEVFGRNGTMLLPMFAGLPALLKDAARLGIAPTKQQVADAHALGDAWTDIKAAIALTAFNVGAALAPAILEFKRHLIPILGVFNRWVAANPQLVAGLAAVGVALTVIGAAVASAGVAMIVLGAAITAATAVAASEFAAIAAAIIFVVAVVASLTIVLLKVTGILDRLLTLGRASFNGLYVAAQRTVNGIANALKAGDIELAWRITTTAMMVQWYRFAQTVFQSIADINRAIVSTFGGLLGRLILEDELSITNIAGELARGAGLEAWLKEVELRRLTNQAARGAAQAGQGGKPGDYGLPTAGAGIVGTNAFAAVRGAGVIGSRGVLDTLNKQLALEAKMEAHLAKLEKRRPAKVR